MRILLKLVTLCLFFELACSLQKKTHPPVWEYTYQYELFEKIYRQVQYLLTDVRILSNKLSDRTCPQNWKTGNSACYFLALYRKLNWLQSQETCERVGAHLAVLENEQENTFVSNYLSEVHDKYGLALSNVWIGGFRYNKDGAWHWVSGENVTYDNWEPDVADSDTGGRHCIVSTGHHWNVHRCSKDLHYLCERQPTLY